MTFTPKVWVNGTLVTAAVMVDMETRLAAYSDGISGGGLNVKDFGAVGDGVTDNSSAFLACSTAYNSAVQLIGGQYRYIGSIKIPAGIYYISTPGVLMHGTGLPGGAKPSGWTLRGEARFTTGINYTPSSAGALCSNPDIISGVTMTGVAITGGNSNAIFLNSVSQGGGTQNYVFRDMYWNGTWNDGIQLAGNATANLNSEILFDKCGAHGVYTGAFFHVGTGGAFQQQDQFVNYDFNACELELTSGNIIQTEYGGSIRVRGGSMIINTNGTCFKLNTGAHNQGATNLYVEGQRVELRASTVKLLDCAWKDGSITFVSVDTQVSQPTWTTALMSVSGDSGPIVTWDNCRIGGQHEYQFNDNTYKGAPGRAIYRNCYIAQTDLQDLIINTAVAGSDALGGRWQVDFEGCRGNSTFGTNGADRAWDVVSNWQTRKNAEVTRRSRSLKSGGGTFPTSSGGWGATIDVWMPLNCVITDIHCSRPASGADTATAWSYTLKTSEGSPTTLATIAPGTQWKNGWSVHVYDLWFVADTDVKRHLVLTALAITSYDTLGMFVIDYLPGA